MSLYDVFKAKAPCDPVTGKPTIVGSFLAGASAGLIAQTTVRLKVAFSLTSDDVHFGFFVIMTYV